MIQESDAPRIAAEVTSRMVAARLAQARAGGRPIEHVLNETMFHERRRLARARGVEEDKKFYKQLAAQLPRASEAQLTRMLSSVVERYVSEIEGHFDPRIYQLATRVLPMGTGALLNAMSARKVMINGTMPSFDKRILIDGDISSVHRLAERGTVLFVPTHSSNLDSIIMGSGLYQLGLPPATYGAGLNLFQHRLIGFFMRNLGAYTVDRLKTDPLYKNTLKEYSTVILEFGRHQLFFPGGTRGRSGMLEGHLKKGLLGTALQAYANNVQRGKDRRMYIVPVTINYPLVLEASTLIDDYLQESGRARYIIEDDEFSKVERWAAYGRGLFRLDMYIYLRFGSAYDPFGNPVTPTGESLDPHGRIIDPSGYLRRGGEVVQDGARDAEYTRMLASKIVDSYQINNIACATHVVSFALFHHFWQTLSPQDVYRFLRRIGEYMSVSKEDFLPVLERLLRELRARSSRGEIRLEHIVRNASAEDILHYAMAPLAFYHTTPVVKQADGRLFVGDANLLFYYRNRLEGYGLLGEPNLLETHQTS